MPMEMMLYDCLNRIFSIKYTLFIILAFSPFFLSAQEGTLHRGAKPKQLTGKIMLIPFEPKLYMSEIDKKINDQTKWNFNQIRENFRHNLDVQLQQKFKDYGSVISFYSDSVKMSKDLRYIYDNSNLSFDPLNKPRTASSPQQKNTGIKDGQVAVEISEEKKFTNVVVSDLKVLPYLNKKYTSEYFVFVNQLDIKNDAASYDIHTDSYLRKVDVHYTILDKNGTLITAGVASSSFSSKENNPKKIIGQSFYPIATYISVKFNAILHPPPPAPKKEK